MEQQSHFSGTSNLPESSTDSFPNGASIEHSAEFAAVPFRNQVHFLQYQFYSDSYENDVNREAYLDGVDVNRNSVNENIFEDNLIPPYEEYVNDSEYVPLENLNYDYLNNVDQYNWHQEDFYNGANFETNYVHQYSTNPIANYTSYSPGGMTYFTPHQNTTSNGLHSGHATYAQSQPGPTNTGTALPDAAPQISAEADATVAECCCCFNSTNVGSDKEATKPETPWTNAINAESVLETTNTEIPNIDDTSEIKTPPGTTKAETILEGDASELADTLSECLISDSSNTEFQPNSSYSNSQCIVKETNYEGSLNSNLGDRQNSGDGNSDKHVDDKHEKNVSDKVENGGNGGQICRNRNASSNANRRNKKDNRRQVSGSNVRRGDSSGISFKNFNSRRNSRSSSDYNSLNTKNLNDRNGSDGLENADSRQGSGRNNGNSDAANSKDFQSCNGTCRVHCDIEGYGKDRVNYETSGASELHKSNSSYSAAVKRSLNSVH